MNKAIQKAIEGGWKPERGFSAVYQVGTWHIFSEPTLDPLFWQALGKAMGWKFWYHTQTFKAGKKTSIGGGRENDKFVYQEWQYQIHRFIDHLIAGNDADSFFNDLLK